MIEYWDCFSAKNADLKNQIKLFSSDSQIGDLRTTSLSDVPKKLAPWGMHSWSARKNFRGAPGFDEWSNATIATLILNDKVLTQTPLSQLLGSKQSLIVERKVEMFEIVIDIFSINLRGEPMPIPTLVEPGVNVPLIWLHVHGTR